MKNAKNMFFRFIFLSFAAVLLFGCMSSTSAGLVGADRGQLFLYSESQMNQSAASQYSQVIAEAKAAKTLNTNAATYRRVQNIADKLIAQTKTFQSDALDWDWEVNVITDFTVNAWCMPGGKIVVYTGIIDSLNLTDGELAAVMGHEISHALDYPRVHRGKRVQILSGDFGKACLDRLGKRGEALRTKGVRASRASFATKKRMHEFSAGKLVGRTQALRHYS